MKQAQRVLSTYAVDLFGMCSALYELGGLVVMHDASGCNSTYTTHDEPRWYDTPSMVYISGLREADTIYGNDQRLIDNIAEVAEATHPNFIAIGGSPMPNAIGTDLRAVARLVEKRTGIPSLGIRTDGIHSYLPGAGEGLKQFAERFVEKPEVVSEDSVVSRKIKVNLLGVTPLDFSVVGNVIRLKELVAEHGMELQSCWAMGDTFEVLKKSARADVNAVVSSIGLPTARWMKENFGIPYVTGLPVGKTGTEAWIRALKASDENYLFEKHDWRKVVGSGAELLSLNAWISGKDAGKTMEKTTETVGKVAGTTGNMGEELATTARDNGSGTAGKEPGTTGNTQEELATTAVDNGTGTAGEEPGTTGNMGEELETTARDNGSGTTGGEPEEADAGERTVLLIGEPVQIRAIQFMLKEDLGLEHVRLVCPMADAPKELMRDIEVISVETALREACRQADRVIADPIYARLLPEAPEKFISLPHEAYSGRHYREEIPVFIGDTFTEWMEKKLITLNNN